VGPEQEAGPEVFSRLPLAGSGRPASIQIKAPDQVVRSELVRAGLKMRASAVQSWQTNWATVTGWWPFSLLRFKTLRVLWRIWGDY
jgi:hypothetical protein